MFCRNHFSGKKCRHPHCENPSLAPGAHFCALHGPAAGPVRAICGPGPRPGLAPTSTPAESPPKDRESAAVRLWLSEAPIKELEDLAAAPNAGPPPRFCGVLLMVLEKMRAAAAALAPRAEGAAPLAPAAAFQTQMGANAAFQTQMRANAAFQTQMRANAAVTMPPYAAAAGAQEQKAQLQAPRGPFGPPGPRPGAAQAAFAVGATGNPTFQMQRMQEDPSGAVGHSTFQMRGMREDPSEGTGHSTFQMQGMVEDPFGQMGHSTFQMPRGVQHNSPWGIPGPAFQIPRGVLESQLGGPPSLPFPDPEKRQTVCQTSDPKESQKEKKRKGSSCCGGRKKAKAEPTRMCSCEENACNCRDCPIHSSLGALAHVAQDGEDPPVQKPCRSCCGAPLETDSAPMGDINADAPPIGETKMMSDETFKEHLRRIAEGCDMASGGACNCGPDCNCEGCEVHGVPFSKEAL